MIPLIFIVCVLLFFVRGEYEPPSKVDFEGFRNAVRHAISKSSESDLVKDITPKSTSLDCHMPRSSIILTLTNFYTIELFSLQHKGLELWNLKECIESRFVSVCLDEKCINVCKESSINNCFLLPIETLASDYLQNSFRYLMYLKHQLMYESLQVVEEVMFFDVDVILFRNPWMDTLYQRHDDGTLNLKAPRPDMMWQAEWRYNMSCAGTPNGGQLYMRNSTKVNRFYQNFFALKNVFLGSGPVDQDKIEELAANASMVTCSLPHWRYTAYNLLTNAPFNQTARVMDIVSYHASGVTGLKHKIDHIVNMYKGVESKDPTKLAYMWI